MTCMCWKAGDLMALMSESKWNEGMGCHDWVSADRCCLRSLAFTSEMSTFKHASLCDTVMGFSMGPSWKSSTFPAHHAAAGSYHSIGSHSVLVCTLYAWPIILQLPLHPTHSIESANQKPRTA